MSANKLADIQYIPDPEIGVKDDLKYVNRFTQYSLHRIPGSLFRIKIDNTLLLFYGYKDDYIPAFKSSSTAVKRSEDLYVNPAIYTDNPLISGYCSDENIRRISGSAFCTIHSNGRGTIISLYDITKFRTIWFGTSKIFLNAVFFGQIL